MKFLADEGVEAQIVARLRLDGHDIEYVAELAPGITDDQVLARANDAVRVLITVDKDFGELVFRLRSLNGQQMPGAFTVVSPGAIRIRPPI